MNKIQRIASHREVSRAQNKDTARKALRANKLLFDRLSAGGCTCERTPTSETL